MKGRMQLAILVIGVVASKSPDPAEGRSPRPFFVQEKPPAAAMYTLLAPVALYPDALLSQILMCAESPFQVRELSEWLAASPTLQGSALQEAAQAEGFDPSFVAISMFPQVVQMMAQDIDWTRQLGEAFAGDRAAVFESVQRLRADAMAVGNLQSTQQQEVTTQTTQSGQEVIVIQPANPQVIYVPQYNPQVVYTTPPPPPAPTTVVVEDGSDQAAATAAVVAFTAGVIITAAASNNYYYGSYGRYGGAYMYEEAWDDYYDHREDAREDWQDHHEDMAGQRGEQQTARQEGTSERQTTRQDAGSGQQATRQEGASQPQATAQASGRSPSTSTASYGSRGYSQGGTQPAAERSGTRSSAFSGYGSGSSERAASSRGRSSISTSRGGGRRRP